MASLKKLFSDSVVYGLSSIVGRFLNYLLVPLYTYHISAASGGYGVVTNVYAYTALLLVILTFGMETTFSISPTARATTRQVVLHRSGRRGRGGAGFVALVMALLGPISAAMGYATTPSTSPSWPSSWRSTPSRPSSLHACVSKTKRGSSPP